MSEKDSRKISELEQLDQINGSEQLPVARAGATKRISVQQIIDSVDKTTIGLERVENIAPMDMPVSVAQLQEINKKAPINHRHSIGEVAQLTETLETLAAKDHTHTGFVISGEMTW